MTAKLIEIAFTAVMSGVCGGLIGGLIAWGGIRVRLNNLEAKAKDLGDSVVYKDVFEQFQFNVNKSVLNIESDIREMRAEIRVYFKKD